MEGEREVGGSKGMGGGAVIEDVSRSAESLSNLLDRPTMDQLIDAETFAAADFFRICDMLRRKLTKGDVMLMDLLPAKRKLRWWIQTVIERSQGVIDREEVMEPDSD